MLKLSRKKRRTEKQKKLAVILLAGLIASFCMAAFSALRTGQLMQRLKYELCILILRQYTPVLMEDARLDLYEEPQAAYETQTESELKYEQILAREAADENVRAGQTQAQETPESTPVSLDKLNDFDYLVQHYYTVDKVTTTDADQLNAKKLLAIDCTMEKKADGDPQILIYHTHSQEGYVGSEAGNLSTTVVGLGDRLTQILEDTYGYSVLHDKGTYDLGDRDHAYSKSAPALEKILKENPSIEVVIDLHRDGVGENTRLATEVDGKPTAKIMFFNGLGRIASAGNVSQLKNPYIDNNLAFSLKMQLAANELYPDFTRKIYLKGYRYNMQYCPKSLLIEVGAQTNTLEEAMNAMDPLARVLDKVLSGT